MHSEILAAIAIFVLFFGAFSRRIERSVITPPMAYVLYGLLLSSLMFGITRDVSLSNDMIQILAESTLTVVLFTDASRIQVKQLRESYKIPLRLLGLGLPISIILGTLLGLLLFPTELNVWEAAALSTILAPTDAALGQAVVNSRQVPSFIRQAINVESGLNDGICLPFLLLFLSLAEESTGATDAAYWLTFSAQQVLFGVGVGVAVGYLASQLISKSVGRKWISESFERLSVLGIAFLAYTGATLLGGNGFIAAFCAGLVSGNVTSDAVKETLYAFGEAEGQLLTLVTFLLFGAVMVMPALEGATVQVWLYAVGSLTVVRLVSVGLATVGARLQGVSVLFVGWFGPRGIASIVYGLLILEEKGLAGGGVLFDVMAVTVLVSVFAHGLSAYPGASWYGRKIGDCGEGMVEMRPVAELPVRLPWRA